MPTRKAARQRFPSNSLFKTTAPKRVRAWLPGRPAHITYRNIVGEGAGGPYMRHMRAQG